VPQTHSSVPIRLLQLCALPPAANGAFGSADQSPPKLFVYVNDVPSSNVILLPDLPEVWELLDGELLLTGELPCFFVTTRATGMAIAAAITIMIDKDREMSKIFFFRNVWTFGSWRVSLADELFRGVGELNRC
jgi:hypothetical protein